MQASRRKLLLLVGLMFVIISLAACAQSVPTVSPTSVPTPTPQVENRVVQLEWPARMRLGELDVIRLVLAPSAEGYDLTAEFPEHQTETQEIPVPRPDGYYLISSARLDGVGFRISPEGEQDQYLPAGRGVAWLWSISPKEPGQQRLTVSLLLRWQPVDDPERFVQESVVYTQGLDIRVSSFLGLSQSQAMAGGFLGLVFGGGLSMFAFFSRPGSPKPKIFLQAPNPKLHIEPHTGLNLDADERRLLQAIFHRYGRLVIEKEFLSGYSGARTFLALPVQKDGRSDAHTIVKIGDQNAIWREYQNYEQFVKDRLPPITARIQHAPVTASGSDPGPLGGHLTFQPGKAALRYTFIGTPGSSPRSLRETLLKDPDPALLLKLFNTFGPNWWMQRSPYTFRLAQEYDQLLPPHLVVKPVPNSAGRLPQPAIKIDERTRPDQLQIGTGSYVLLGSFEVREMRADRNSQTLVGKVSQGQPALRIRWLGLERPGLGQVIATRQSLPQELGASYDRFGLPDPLSRLPELLAEVVRGTRSTVHGDLNLENILVGPGNFVWLIDFAQTREGHTLLDIAHLRTELIAHILAPGLNSTQDYFDQLQNPGASPNSGPMKLIATLDEIAAGYLFNPSDPREYYLACTMSCLGALKYKNLTYFPKQLLYLTAAHLAQAL